MRSLVKSKVLVNDNLKVVGQNKRDPLSPHSELDLSSVQRGREGGRGEREEEGKERGKGKREGRRERGGVGVEDRG